MNAQDYCFKRSFLLRLRRQDSEILIDKAYYCLPPVAWNVGEETLALIDENIRAILGREVYSMYRGRRYGNPLIIFFLLKIIIPIIVQLVIQWWLNRDEDSLPAKEGISQDDYKNWADWIDHYVAIPKADLIRKMRKARAKMKFSS